jgi:hypothetical protein
MYAVGQLLALVVNAEASAVTYILHFRRKRWHWSSTMMMMMSDRTRPSRLAMAVALLLSVQGLAMAAYLLSVRNHRNRSKRR